MRLLTLTAVFALVGGGRADWEPVTVELLKTEKPGNFGLCGVAVDHRHGDVYVNLSDKGFYRSTDQGKTWKRLNQDPIKGRTEWPGCLMIDPLEGKKIVVALVYGSPIVASTDMGATWKTMDKKSSHVDWFAIDWSDPEMKYVLTLKHESGDLLLSSRDGGKSFTEIGKGYGPAWIFDNQTAVVVEAKSKAKPMPKILRTTDGGKTLEPVAEYSARALPKLHQGELYWLTENALITTMDKGQTWKKISDVKDGRYGPIFGKSAEHMFVLTQGGIIETTDGGATWTKPLALPKELKGVGMLSWMEYDPVHDVIYTMKMASDLYRMERKKN